MTVLGIGPTLANLNRKAVEIMKASGDGIGDAAAHVRDEWVRNIESEGLVDTGHYRDSVEVTEEGGQAVVYTNVEYSRFLEFGTSRMPAHPVAERAADESHEEVLDAVSRSVGGVL